MDILISNYLQDSFTPELKTQLQTAFRLYDSFELQDYESDFIDLLMMQEMSHAEDTHDQFIMIVNEKLDFIINEHRLKLTDEATLYHKVQILEALYAVQHLNDYSNIAIVLESNEDPEIQLTDILSQLCELKAATIFPLIESFDPSALDLLKQFVYGREEATGMPMTSLIELQKKVLENFKLFLVFAEKNLKTQKPLAVHVVESGFMVGQPLERYIPFVKDGLNAVNFDQLSVDVLSIILLTDEGYNNPLITYRQHSHLLLDELTIITRVDSILVHILGLFETYRELVS